MRKAGLFMAAAVAVLGAGPALAAGVFTPPKGCTGYLTVQMRGCIVTNHYRCDADPKGDQWRVDFNQDGPFFVSHTDAETQWVETFDLALGSHEVLQKGAKEPASFSTLLAKGADSYDFSTVTDDGKVEHVTGTDKLTGKSEELSGVRLEQTEYDTTAKDADGGLVWHSKGHEWISRDWRIFLAGAGTWEDQDGTTPFDNTPMMLSQPGQKGFMSTDPQYDCNAVNAGLALPVLPAKAVVPRP